jgi:hypothetical protein
MVSGTRQPCPAGGSRVFYGVAAIGGPLWSGAGTSRGTVGPLLQSAFFSDGKGRYWNSDIGTKREFPLRGLLTKRLP